MVNQSFFTKILLKKIKVNEKNIKCQWNNPKATNTRYFYLDNLLPKNICKEIFEAFPKNAEGFFDRESFREKKKTSANLSAYDSILSDITYAFQDKKVINLISQYIGFDSIEPDPKLYAGGLSMMFKGDFLNPHIDNSHDGERKRYRRLNLLYYVSPNWKLKNGGNLELWNEDRTKPKTLPALTNRLIVMETNKTSWHSVSKVEIDSPRCCVSNYYFSKISPDQSEYFHVTSFTGRPNEILKRVYGVLDNTLRNIVSKSLKIGRGKALINKSKKK
jgi:Rps23 Pro-64 3,4-dihydroxylase Tpa1-like proline 4-hydroxylase